MTPQSYSQDPTVLRAPQELGAAGATPLGSLEAANGGVGACLWIQCPREGTGSWVGDRVWEASEAPSLG